MGEHPLHILGNGHMFIVAEHGRILCVTGPSYSFTNYVRLDALTIEDQTADLSARRIAGTGCWLYESALVRCLDFMPAGRPAFCRRVAAAQSGRIRIHLRCPAFIRIEPLPEGSGAVLAAPEDVNMSAFGGHVPVKSFAGFKLVGGKNVELAVASTGEPYYQEVEVTDQFSAHQGRFWDQAAHGLVLSADIEAGEDLALWFVTGLDESQVRSDLAELGAGEPEEVQARAFEGQRRWRAGLNIPPKASREAALILESVGVALAAQTGREGGVIAGHKFPMCYPQDMNFVVSGLLGLGQHDAVRGVLRYLAAKTAHFGCTSNADDLGLDANRNPYENEDVFIPATELFMMRIYHQATGDWDTLRDCWDWAQSSYGRLAWGLVGRPWKVPAHCEEQTFYQHVTGDLIAVSEGRRIAEDVGREGVGILGGDLFPFHGDETERWPLVKAGDIPNVMDASVESALYFIAGARFYAEMARRFGTEEQALDALSLADRAERAMERTFWHGGYFVANSLPAESTLPDHRVGSCHMCNRFRQLRRHRCDYYCEVCVGGTEPLKSTRVHRRRFNAASALRPAYTGYFQTGDKRLTTTLDYVLGNYRSPETGLFRSNDRVPHAVGHLIGMALTAATVARDERAHSIYETIIANVGSQWTYPEYYGPDGEPYGCQLRPMESGTNIGAIVKYLQDMA